MKHKLGNQQAGCFRTLSRIFRELTGLITILFSMVAKRFRSLARIVEVLTLSTISVNPALFCFRTLARIRGILTNCDKNILS